MSKQNKSQHPLDRNTQSLVKWYSECFARPPQAVINGILTGALERLRHAFDEGIRECSDESDRLNQGVIEEDVIAAMRRRHAR